MIYLEEEQRFVRQIESQKKQVENNKRIVLTKFLTLREQAIVSHIFKHASVDVHFYGGFKEAERKRCLMIDRTIPMDEKMFETLCFRIDYHRRYLDLKHPHVLGTLMSLQLDRSLFGDIVFHEDEVYFYTTKEIAPILYQELTTINGVPVSIEEVQGSIEPTIAYEEKEIIVSSLRIDNLISAAFRLSRSVAEDLIRREVVYRNFQIVNQKSTLCESGDILSVRRHGRFTIGEAIRTTKSNRHVIKIRVP